jgi:carbonic anhydrase
MIINHTDCGMLKFTDAELENRLRKETGQAAQRSVPGPGDRH